MNVNKFSIMCNLSEVATPSSNPEMLGYSCNHVPWQHHDVAYFNYTFEFWWALPTSRTH